MSCQRAWQEIADPDEPAHSLADILKPQRRRMMRERAADNRTIRKRDGADIPVQTAIRQDTAEHFMQNRRRLNAALQLVETDEPILAVALACGFNDVSEFNRRLRRTFG